MIWYLLIQLNIILIAYPQEGSSPPGNSGMGDVTHGGGSPMHPATPEEAKTGEEGGGDWGGGREGVH